MIDTKPVEDASKDLAADLAALRSDVAKLTASIAKMVKAEASSTTETVYGAMDVAKQKISERATDAKGKIGDVSSELEASIERNPLTAVMIALAAGLVIGLVSRGK